MINTLIGLYFAFMSLFSITSPVSVTQTSNIYYLEPGPKDYDRTIVNNEKLDEKRIYSIEDIPTRLNELNKLNEDNISKWSRYNSGDFGILPGPADQGGYMICWAFSNSNTSEVNILKEGLEPISETKDFKLSALNIAYTTSYRDGNNDPLNNTPLDKSDTTWNDGSYIFEAQERLTQWISPVKSIYEDGYYITNYPTPDYLLEDAVTLNDITNIEDIKKLISKYGAVTMAYDTDFSGRDFYNSNGIKGQAHAISIVGWDDNVAVSNFTNTPSRPGAWLTKNSWGSGHGSNGLQYLSYDSPISEIYAYDYRKYEENLNNYYYDTGVKDNGEITQNGNNPAVAGVIFESKKASSNNDEYLESISVKVNGYNDDIKVEIYKNVNANLSNRLDAKNSPIKGDLVSEATTTRHVDYPGSYTVYLDTKVKLDPYENYSIVVSVSNKTNDASIKTTTEYNSYNDLTYYKDGKDWKSTFYVNDSVARIKAHTKTVKKDGIEHKDLRGSRISLDNYLYEYDNRDIINQNIKVTIQDKELIENQDYIISYNRVINPPTDLADVSTNVGYLDVFINGINDYANTYNRISIPMIMSMRPTSDAFLIKGNYVDIKVPIDAKTLKDVDVPDDWSIIESLDTLIDEDKAYTLIYQGKDSNLYRQPMVSFYVVRSNASDTNINNNNLTIEGLKDEYTYLGEQIRPKVIVKYDGNVLNFNEDYLIEYKDNVNVGNAKIIIRGIGNYTGKKEFNFKINKANNMISKFEIVNNKIISQAQYGQVQLKYYSDENCLHPIDILESGHIYYVKPYVLGDLNYNSVSEDNTLKGLKYVYNDSSQIKDKTFTSEDIILNKSEFDYTGKDLLPEIKIIKDQKELLLNKDYLIEYPSDCKNVGIKQIIIKGINDYKNSNKVTIEYRINQVDNKIYSFTKENDQYKVTSKFNSNGFSLKYYSDDKGLNLINEDKLNELNTYYVRAYIKGNSNYRDCYSSNLIRVDKIINNEELTTLNNLIYEYENMDMSNYSQESIDEFNLKLNKIKSKVNDNLSKEEINALMNELNSIKSDLKLIENNNQSSNKNNNQNLIIIISVSISVIVVVSVGISIYFIRRKNKDSQN